MTKLRSIGEPNMNLIGCLEDEDEDDDNEQEEEAEEDDEDSDSDEEEDDGKSERDVIDNSEVVTPYSSLSLSSFSWLVLSSLSVEDATVITVSSLISVMVISSCSTTKHQ